MTKSKIEFYWEKRIVRKHYHKAEEYQRELEIYNKSWKILPSLLNTGKNWLEISFKPGENLWEQDSVDFAVIGRLYAQLHNYESRDGKVICQIDTNPRNVLYCLEEKKYYLIDFVDWRWEKAEFDLIHFLLFWAGALSELEFYVAMKEFLAGYNTLRSISAETWQELYPQVVQYFDGRREHFGKREKKGGGEETINRKMLKKAVANE
ncbi:MAG: hypothetical protein K9N07_07270 [Candidatus Cloacimonetes bacterium]|nr:hypothetical protein [Candidatus Cloacimonadota bacterium]